VFFLGVVGEVESFANLEMRSRSVLRLPGSSQVVYCGM